jgi:hypothetical protein
VLNSNEIPNKKVVFQPGFASYVRKGPTVHAELNGMLYRILQKTFTGQSIDAVG